MVLSINSLNNLIPLYLHIEHILKQSKHKELQQSLGGQRIKEKHKPYPIALNKIKIKIKRLLMF